MRPASSNHIFCIARNTGQLHQKKHDLTMRAKIKTDTVYATLPILSSFPFDHMMPEVIIFEHNHLSDTDYKNAVIYLQKIGYGLLRVGTDTFCYSKTLSNIYSVVSKRLF